MRKFFWVPLLVFIFFIFFTASSLAQSSYVLPYPSAMPGNFLYKPRLIFEKVAQLWYFGNFGQFAYSLKQSDKYLVQAKTLFEYNQYLLAYDALKKSDRYFEKTFLNLEGAEDEGKDISQNRKTLSLAAEKHTELLAEIKEVVPAKFNWQPEKSASTLLDLESAIKSSISIRMKYL
ncbi:MAG: hypothetical protein WD967_02120 [Candidatus Levyibacteriota bacterium]